MLLDFMHISLEAKLELLFLAAARQAGASVMPAQFAALAGYAALHADIHDIKPTMVDLSITTAPNHLAIQLFVAGLKHIF
jgi:hypothetical protein